MKIVSLTPDSVAHTLMGMYRSFQQCGAGAVLPAGEFQVTQFTERDHSQPDPITHIRLTGQGPFQGYRLQVTGPAIHSRGNPANTLEYWFGQNAKAAGAFAHLLSAFGSDQEVEERIPFLNQVVRRKEDVNCGPSESYCHIVVGRDPCTGDLITFRAEAADKKFRITSIKSSDVNDLVVVPAELETAIRVAFMMQRLGPKDLANLIDKSAVDALWSGQK